MEPSPLKKALETAPLRAQGQKARPEQEFFCFKIGELRLGVPSENVREVVRAGPLTPLPRTAPFVLGVCGHRGEVLPVLDLLRFLGKGESRIGPRTRLFIGVSGTYLAAVVADLVIGLRRVPLADILPPPVGGDAAVEHLIGVLGAGQADSVSLLNLAKLLQTARQRAVQR